MTARPTDNSTLTVFPAGTFTLTSSDSVMVSEEVVEEDCSDPTVRLNPPDTSTRSGIPALTDMLTVDSILVVVLQVVDLVTDLLYVSFCS